MTRHALLQDIHGSDVELARLEWRSGLLLADFSSLSNAGELEQTRDDIQWWATTQPNGNASPALGR